MQKIVEYQKFLEAIVDNNKKSVQELLPSCDKQLDSESKFRGGRTTPIHLASYLGRAGIVKQLIAAQVDVNLPTSRGETPLFFAVQNGHSEVVDLLIRAQAETDLQQFQGAAPLHIAAQDGLRDEIRLLVKAQADVNLQEANGCTPLYFACQNGSRECIETLIDSGADVNHQTSTGESPLYAAAQADNRRVVWQLLKANADVNLREADGWTPLSIAVQEGYTKLVEMLIRAQADVDLQSVDGRTPLYIACQAGHYHIAKMLMLAQANVSLRTADGRFSLYTAAQKGHDSLVKLLICAQADVNLTTVESKSPLHAAAENRHRDVIKLLLKAMADLDMQTEQGLTALIVASQNDDCSVADLLIQSQADLNRAGLSGETPLHIASTRSSYRLTTALIQGRVNSELKNDRGQFAIQLAAKSGRCDILKVLIESNADVNAQDPHGATAVYLASQENHAEVLKLLVCALADTNVGAKEDAAPIYIASQEGYKEAVDVLVHAQADVNRQVSSGQSPLYIASQNGHCQVVNLLLKAGAMVDKQDIHGFTPIYMASQGGHELAVKSLIKAQADVNLEWKYFLTPLHIASQENHPLIVDSLIEAAANVDAQRDTGDSALHLASHWGHGRVVSSLLAAQADANLRERGGYSPLLIASQAGHHDIVQSLIRAYAIIDQRIKTGKTALHAAAQFGHLRVVQLLLEARADAGARRSDGKTPLDMALHHGHQNIVKSLEKFQEMFDTDENAASAQCESHSQKSTEVARSSVQSRAANERSDATAEYVGLGLSSSRDETKLSLQLHFALTQAGFVSSRAELQSAVADALEKIMRDRQNDDEVFVVGSYSEGWGNSLSRLDGRTDIESDIDVVQLMPGRLYHMKGFCKCLKTKTAPTDYSNGHITIEGFASNPARPENGSALRPAVDRVSACRLCCYPPIGPLQPQRVAQSHIPQSVLQSLSREMDASLCHVVHAAPPGQAGKQLRVSTTFLERRLLRSLSTLQGQLFVTLKFLVKKVIGRRVQGLKAYHAKTVTFRMLEETPAEHWRPENLMSLVRQSLQMLLDFVEGSCGADNVDGRIMEHFFLIDAGLYLKGADRSDSEKIVEVLRDVMYELPQLLIRFKESLQKIDIGSAFHFHPFLILPEIDPMFSAGLRYTDYYNIYDIVRDSFYHVSESSSAGSLGSVLQVIEQLPDCANLARVCLIAMAYLKFGNREAAIKVLSDSPRHTVRRGVKRFTGGNNENSAESAVFSQLLDSDLAWRFSLMYLRRPDLSHTVPKHLAEWFPLRMENYDAFYYVNFDALRICLACELLPHPEEVLKPWLVELLQRDDADVLELLTALHYCRDASLTKTIIEKFRQGILDSELASSELQRVIERQLTGLNEAGNSTE